MSCVAHVLQLCCRCVADRGDYWIYRLYMRIIYMYRLYMRIIYMYRLYMRIIYMYKIRDVHIYNPVLHICIHISYLRCGHSTLTTTHIATLTATHIHICMHISYLLCGHSTLTTTHIATLTATHIHICIHISYLLCGHCTSRFCM